MTTIVVTVVTAVIVATITAVITSMICCNISAVKTFNIIDEYVKDLIESTKQLIRETYFDKRAP
ncbi:MAG: hypothetical protein HFI26_08370 [Lachnospiraceae bacterium]|nr:hypothetical protein [Lachnospiraceae bacterium]